MDLNRCPLTEEEKHSMIADAALRKSEKRGFAAGDPLKNWHKAEADLEKALNVQCKPQPHQPEKAESQGERRGAWKILAHAEEKAGRWGQNWVNSRLKPGEIVDGWKDRGIRIWHHTSNSVKDWMSRRRHK
jgi:Protein of unknown function (DUF2934)